MSLPMVLSMLVNSLYNIVDSFFVAQISEEAMTALSLVYPVQNFINAVGIGFGVGINAVIAFYLGAGDYEKADQAATQGLVLAVIHGVVMTVCCIAIMPVFLRMFTASKAVIELGVRYSAVAFGFTLIVTVSMVFEKLFQAVGNMKTTMISLMCGCITNIVLDPVLIFGYGPFAEMGIEGAALAVGVGQALTLAIYLVIYFVRPIRVHIRRQHILPGKKMVIKLYSIGIPATLNLALPSLLISALNAILTVYSEVYILVLGHGSDRRGHFPYHLPQGDCKTCDDGPKGMNAYTISSGIFPKYLNGENIISVPLAENETMHIGYVLNENQELSELGKSYLEELRKYAPANP